jgi:hypothetical protein
VLDGRDRLLVAADVLDNLATNLRIEDIQSDAEIPRSFVAFGKRG